MMVPGSSLGERLERGLLPLFKQLVEEGIEIWADDVKPTTVSRLVGTVPPHTHTCRHVSV
eukprot:3951756-Amphidinium_carterae.1